MKNDQEKNATDWNRWQMLSLWRKLKAGSVHSQKGKLPFLFENRAPDALLSQWTVRRKWSPVTNWKEKGVVRFRLRMWQTYVSFRINRYRV